MCYCAIQIAEHCPWANFSPPWSKNAFTSLNRWKNSKMKSWIIFWDMWKGYWGHISAFTNKVFWEHSHACFVAYCPWLPLCHNDRVLSLQKRPCDMQNPKVYFLAHYENCLPTPLYKDLSFKVWVTLLSFASRRQTQWHSKRATRIPLLASWPSTCVIRNSWRACFSHLIPYDWADPSSMAFRE